MQMRDVSPDIANQLGPLPLSSGIGSSLSRREAGTVDTYSSLDCMDSGRVKRKRGNTANVADANSVAQVRKVSSL